MDDGLDEGYTSWAASRTGVDVSLGRWKTRKKRDAVRLRERRKVMEIEDTRRVTSLVHFCPFVALLARDLQI